MAGNPTGGRALRWNGPTWRRMAYLGSVYGPAWWKRISPPAIAAFLFLAIPANRRAVVANLRRIVGTRGWWSDHRAALRTFVEFAHVFHETLELEGRCAHGCEVDEVLDIDVQAPPGTDLQEFLAPEGGMVVLTSHFGSWEIAARLMQSHGRQVNLVMATEQDGGEDGFPDAFERDGLRVIRSDSSMFAGVGMIRALQRGEVVAIQLDRTAPGQVVHDVDFFGSPASFQVGPFELARLAGVPLWPIYAVRLGLRKYRLLVAPLCRIDPEARREEVLERMRDVVQGFEDEVRAHPNQWFQFHEVWDDD